MDNSLPLPQPLLLVSEKKQTFLSISLASLLALQWASARGQLEPLSVTVFGAHVGRLHSPDISLSRVPSGGIALMTPRENRESSLFGVRLASPGEGLGGRF